MSSTGRKLLICVTDSDSNQAAVEWTMKNLYRQGDEVHLMHVHPNFHSASRREKKHCLTAEAVMDQLKADISRKENTIKDAESFIARRALIYTEFIDPPPVIHITQAWKNNAKSVGSDICHIANALKAAVTVLARCDRTKVQELPLGRVSDYCLNNCKHTMVIH